MKELSSALHALTLEEYMVDCRFREDNLKAMRSQGWQLVREVAKKLIVTLAPRTIENRKYLKIDSEWSGVIEYIAIQKPYQK